MGDAAANARPGLREGKDEVVPFAAAERLRAAAGGKALVVPIDGEAYHSFDLSHIAPVVWRALDQIAAEEAAAAK